MKKVGSQSIQLDNKVYILSSASIVGPKESEGPLCEYFDLCLDDEFWGEKTWEKAESKIIKETVNMAIAKSGVSSSDIDLCFAGDLLNQCISTFIEAICLGSVFISSGASKNVICATSSHFCSAEKQFRYPLELGNQRPQSAQWTVTGSGSVILSTSSNNSPYVSYLTPRKNRRHGRKGC